MLVAEQTTTATKLAKDTSRVLDDAAKGPVSLVRKSKPAITLVNSATWHDAALAKQWLSILSIVVSYTIARVKGETEAGYPAEYAWLRSFDIDDTREFIEELTAAVYGALHTGRSWDNVEAVVTEWRKSAAVIEDEELRARFARTIEDAR